MPETGIAPMCRSSATASTAAIPTRSTRSASSTSNKRAACRHHRPAPLHRAAYAQARARRADLHHLREQRQGGGDRPQDQQGGGRDRFRLDQRPSADHRRRTASGSTPRTRRTATVSVIDLPARKLLGKIKTPRPLAGIAISADGRTVVAVDDAEPKLFLIDTEAGRVRDEVRAQGRAEGRADRPLRAGQQPDRRHQPQQRHGEPDRSVVPRADRDQGRQPADGHGVPRRRAVRRLPGRRLGARDRHSEPAAQDELQGRQGLRVGWILYEEDRHAIVGAAAARSCSARPRHAASPGTRGGFSRPGDHDPGAARARRRGGFRRPHHRPEAVGAARQAGAGREPAGRRHGGRGRRARQGGARWLHAAADAGRDADSSNATRLQEPALRSAQGLRADRAAVAGRFHAGRQSVAAGAFDRRVDQIREGQARRADRRHGGHRDHDASGRANCSRT